MRHLLKFFIILVTLVLFSSLLIAQPKYRTFNQNSLSDKKAKAGKVLSNTVSFVFTNDSTGIPVNSLHARINSRIISVIDNGGFTTIDINEKGKVINATGKTILAGESVTLSFNLEKKAPGAQAIKWYWDVDGSQVGTVRYPIAGTYAPIQNQPNGGNMLEYIYKNIITRPAGLVVGNVTDTSGVGWIRYMKADKKYFPHTGIARCFDAIATGSSRTKPFDKEIKNPHVKKHNNRLLGELHALKLAIIANDSGATEPLDTTALGDLIYNDFANPTDPCNGFTLRQVAGFTDSALTYCNHFDLNPDLYAQLDATIGKINSAFDGEYIAISFIPFVLAGTHTVAEVPFIHPNPSPVPMTRRVPQFSIIDQAPEQFILAQNYPNPFNPITTIEFNLPEPSIVTLKVYNLLGQVVATLIEHEAIEDGEQSVDFDASTLTSGIYFYKIDAQGTGEKQQQIHAVRRMILVK
ncbi:MAG: hypothetical protein C0417_07990 [Chlorobiaceae bacterium]|nr:hypothetical protein [Chlorobiaceae bacterium]